jgi:uncharacterized membrane protein YphA (DoxX/SURF4 family)
MRGLRHLIPKETQDRINQSPITKSVAIVLLLLVGSLLARHGINGMQNRAIATKYGEFTASAAIVVGLIYLLVGGMMVVGGLFALVLG